MDELAITALIKRLARPHPSGGIVIERAAILAAGADSPAVIDWIIANSGIPEATSATPARGGLHGGRLSSGAAGAAKPLRYVIPAQALS